MDALRAAVGPQAALFALAAVGINLHFGYTGLLNFGQVGFMLVGAYGVAISVTTWKLSFWLGVVVFLLAALIWAIILGLPALRLRGDYLAIATLAGGEILRLLFRSNAATPITGGVFGLTQFADAFFSVNPLPAGRYGVSASLAFDHRTLWVMLVASVLALVAASLTFLLGRSPWGRVVRAIREDEDVVKSAGKNVVVYKMQSLALGGAMGSLAGVLLATSQQAVTPDAFIPELTFFAYAIVILGGIGRAYGPIAGALIFWFILAAFDSLLRSLAANGVLPAALTSGQALGAGRFVLVGLGLMALMIFRPQGIFGDRREMVLGAN